MKKIPFTGSAVAIVTPFKQNNTLDEAKLSELIEMHIKEGTDAIVICGTTGEASAMPDAEHLYVIGQAVKFAAGRIPIIAGTGSNDTEHGINLSKEAERLGADALLLVTPYYNKATQKGLVEHFTKTANAVKIPVILYNVPSRTGVNMTPETIYELSKVENIVAVKEASGNIAQVAKIAALCGDNMHIYSGNDDMITATIALGGKGVISVVANILPRETHDMVYKYLEGDTKGSLDLQLKMLDLIDSLFCEVNPIPVKTAMNLLGYEVGKLRLPLCDMEENTLARLKRSLIDYGFKLS